MIRSYLKYIFIIVFFSACNPNEKQVSDDKTVLQTQPLTVPLNIKGGYVINHLTGDSIKPLINSLGDTIQTGIPLSLKATLDDQGKIARPTVSKISIQRHDVVGTNIQQFPDKQEIVFGDTLELKNSNEILDTGSIINVRGEKKLMHEPKPVKTLPLRFKDGATANIQYLDVGQGLSYSFVHTLLFDRKGYLWFGLDNNGLCKYDGFTITNYKVKDGLIHNNVTSLLEDSSGNIWIGTEGGLSIFDGNNITQYAKESGFPGGEIDNLYKDGNGNIWMTSYRIGTVKYDGKNFTHYSNKNGSSKQSFTPFFIDSRGSVWMRDRSGISKFDGNKIIHFPIQKNGIINSTYATIEDKTGNLWITTTKDGLFKCDGKKIMRYTIKEGLSSNSLGYTLEDSEGNIWIGTRQNGLNKFDGVKFTTYGIDQGVTNNSVSHCAEDRDGNIWYSTTGGGVNKLNDKSFSEIVKMNDLGNSRVRPMMKDADGNLWFGTEAGFIFKYDGRTLASYKNSDITSPQGLRSMLQDKKGNLWFGYTDGAGLSKYDKKNFLHFSTLGNSRVHSIMSILEDRNGIIWLGTFEGGVTRFDGNTFNYYSEKEGFPGSKVFTMLEDKKGNLWFGTQGAGVVKYDGNNFITFSIKEGLYGKGVTSIIEDKNENIWFATLGAGVCKFDGSNFTYFTEKEGLSFNDVWSLKEDSAGQVWAGTDKGLSVLIPQKDSLRVEKNYSIYNFGLQDGLKSTDFNLHSVSIDNTNRIWWGTGKALITRDLNIPFKPSAPISLNLTNIEINGQFCDFRNLPDSLSKKIVFSSIMPFNNYPQNLKLTYDQNHLSFHFSAINWSAPDKTKYSYRLRGLDTKWSDPSEEPIADYRNLGHGKYEFQVKAFGQYKKWTEPIIFKFVIQPAWWQTWWFKTLFVTVVVFVLLFIARMVYLYRFRKQRALLEKQLAIQYERQRISSEMHDDIGAGISSVRLLTEITKNKLKDTTATNEIDNIYRSVGDISTKMQEVIWSLNAENDHLNNLIYFIQKQVRSLLEHFPCKLSFELPSVIPDIELSGEIRRNIYLVVKEAVHNIIKHSEADKVKLTITFDEKLVIKVSDNGKGINNKNNNGGNGLRNMQQRIKQLNGNILIQNQEGLTVVFEIPVKIFL